MGGPAIFDAWLLFYVEKFKFKSLSTTEWKNSLYEYFINQPEKLSVLDAVDWEAWLHSPGLPPEIPAYDRSLVDAYIKLARRWRDVAEDALTNFTADEYFDLLPNQRSAFLEELLSMVANITVAKLRKMEELYSLDETGNAEIKFAWLRLGLATKWEEVVPKALQMAVQEGRWKFVRPLFRCVIAAKN